MSHWHGRDLRQKNCLLPTNWLTLMVYIYCVAQKSDWTRVVFVSCIWAVVSFFPFSLLFLDFYSSIIIMFFLFIFVTRLLPLPHVIPDIAGVLQYKIKMRGMGKQKISFLCAVWDSKNVWWMNMRKHGHFMPRTQHTHTYTHTHGSLSANNTFSTYRVYRIENEGTKTK